MLPMTGPIAGLPAGQDDRDLTAASAEATLIRACQASDLDPEGARLLRLGEHAMFRLADPIVVRIARTTAYESDARKEVAVAKWLESRDYPAVRALDTRQPLRMDGRVITFWAAVSDDENAYGNTAELAAPVRSARRTWYPRGLTTTPVFRCDVNTRLLSWSLDPFRPPRRRRLIRQLSHPAKSPGSDVPPALRRGERMSVLGGSRRIATDH